MKKILIFLLFINLIFPKDVKIALGDSLPPYIIIPKSGMELEIINKVLEIKGYKMNPVFVPFARLFKSVEQGTYDGVATVKEDKKLKNVYYSDEYITYENIAVSLRNYEIESIADLKDKSVLSFQNAGIYLGEEFGKMIKNNKKYDEIANQEAQVASLMNGRVEVIVIDINMFKYFLKTSKLFKPRPYVVFNIFKPSLYRLAFKDKKIRDDFNEGLKILKSSGKYDEIIKKYVE